MKENRNTPAGTILHDLVVALPFLPFIPVLIPASPSNPPRPFGPKRFRPVCHARRSLLRPLLARNHPLPLRYHPLADLVRAVEESVLAQDAEVLVRSWLRVVRGVDVGGGGRLEFRGKSREEACGRREEEGGHEGVTGERWGRLVRQHARRNVVLHVVRVAGVGESVPPLLARLLLAATGSGELGGRDVGRGSPSLRNGLIRRVRRRSFRLADDDVGALGLLSQ